jgi:hypothetical protein
MSFFSFPKKFNEPLNTVVYTTTYVMKGNSPLLLVSHELDGDWQFMGGEPIDDYTKVAMVVSLEQIIKYDKSVLKVSDLPMGYQAIRNSKSEKWQISKIIYDEVEMKQFGYYCSKCGVYHKEIPMAYGSAAPLLYFSIPEDEREQRCILTDDQCIIDEKHYYIRGGLELSVEDHPGNFSWNLWVEIPKMHFDRMSELWADENRILEPPCLGEVATQLEPYPETKGLIVKVVTQKVGNRPNVELLESTHPLYFEQQEGINMDRVIFFAKEILYNH